MPLPAKSYKDRQALLKEPRRSPASHSPAAISSRTLGEKEKARPTAVPSPSPSSNSLKDTRTHEHERQRLRKAADFVKMRARKAKQGAGWGSTKALDDTGSKKNPGSATPSGKGDRLFGEDVEGDEVEGLVSSEDYSRGVDLGIGIVNTDQPHYEVRLADLVQAGRLRKPKRDADFEVVPHIRSVIVLDDNTPNELDLDEPWEHVGTPECEDTKELSYAQVVVLSK